MRSSPSIAGRRGDHGRLDRRRRARTRSRIDAAETIDCGGRVVMPGLVNAHTHVPMTLLRGLADDLRLDVWLMGYMMPVEREFVSPDFVRLGTRLGCAEMIRSGVTCFADMYYFEEAVAEATADGRHAGAVRADGAALPDARRDELRGSRWRARASSSSAGSGHPLIVPGAGAARALHLHARDPARVRRAGGRVRRPAAHPPLGDRCSKWRTRARLNGMPVVPVGQEAGPVRRQGAGRALRARGRWRDARAEELPTPASRTTRPAT